MSAPLQGLTFRAEGDGTAIATCRRHLERLGATPAAAADVILREETHALLDGGLVASDSTAQAILGMTDYVGPRGGEPARTGMDIGSAVAGFCGVLQVLAAVHGDVERPVQVSLSSLRTLSTLKTILWAARSRPDEWTGTHVRSRDREVDSGYATRDGRITLDFALYAEAGWHSFVQELGVDAATVRRLAPRWIETVGWGDDVDDACAAYEDRLRALSTDEAIALVRRHGGSSVPFLTFDECLAHPQARVLGLPATLARGLPWRTRAEAFRGWPASPRAARPAIGRRAGRRLRRGGRGRFATALLAALGADVVKVEAPNEFILFVRPLVGGISTTYLALNQGKRSVALDLKDARDRAIAQRLIADADVVLENFRPGAFERLGFAFEDLRALNPGIVYCSATGYGWDGPLAAEPCTDPHMQAFSGFAALNAGEGTGRPRRIRYYGFVDLVTSCVIAEAVAAALVARQRQGGAVRVETSMLHGVTATLDAAARQMPGCPDGLFRAADGSVAITCRDDADWARLLAALGQPPALAVDELATAAGRREHRARIERALRELLVTLPAAAWIHAIGRAGVPCARATHDEDAMTRRDLWDMGMLRELPLEHAGPLVVGGPPWPPADGGPPPAVALPGMHTDELRRDPSAFWHSAARPVGASN